MKTICTHRRCPLREHPGSNEYVPLAGDDGDVMMKMKVWVWWRLLWLAAAGGGRRGDDGVIGVMIAAVVRNGDDGVAVTLQDPLLNHNDNNPDNGDEDLQRVRDIEEISALMSMGRVKKSGVKVVVVEMEMAAGVDVDNSGGCRGVAVVWDDGHGGYGRRSSGSVVVDDDDVDGGVVDIGGGDRDRWQRREEAAKVVWRNGEWWCAGCGWRPAVGMAGVWPEKRERERSMCG
ncbi:hypothetical protein Tco_0554529 [Tanacetum coccineum]